MNICIVGAGNIGMRYFEGIVQAFPNAQLCLVDNAARLDELAEHASDKLRLLTSLDDVGGSVDLCIVATSCEPRLSIYKRCIELEPKNIILEKYLFARREEFEESVSLTRIPTFVNQWMYGSKAFDCLFEEPATAVEIAGSGWGLSCNCVHWMDLCKRHLNISRLEVASGTVIDEVFASKRAGYEEITGEFAFRDADSNKSFTLIDRPQYSAKPGMQIRVDEKLYHFDYANILHNGSAISHFPYFSSLIGGIVGDIVTTGASHLPRLAESVSQHLLVEDILATLDRRPRIT